MAEIIIASHGKMAGGTADAVRHLSGENVSLKILEAYIENEPIEETLERLCSQLDPHQQWIFAADLYCGSVAQALAVRFMDRPEQVKIIAGFNLGLILSLLGAPQPAFTDDELRRLIDQSRQEMVLLRDLFHSVSDF